MNINGTLETLQLIESFYYYCTAYYKVHGFGNISNPKAQMLSK